jgi:hypothetical protein
MRRKFVIRIPTFAGAASKLDIAVRTAMLESLREVGIPTAQEAAANASIAESITIVAPYRYSSGTAFSAGLRVPAKYVCVERGTGVYAGHTPWIVVPKRKKVLHFDDGQFAMSAEVLGQPARHFLQKGVAAARQRFDAWCRSSLFKALL